MATLGLLLFLWHEMCFSSLSHSAFIYLLISFVSNRQTERWPLLFTHSANPCLLIEDVRAFVFRVSIAFFIFKRITSADSGSDIYRSANTEHCSWSSSSVVKAKHKQTKKKLFEDSPHHVLILYFHLKIGKMDKPSVHAT